MEPSTDSSPAQPGLSFISLNDAQPTTILLLHGAFSCHLEFALIIPLLSDYHLLIPDLPGHSGSRAIKPATIDNAATHVERLIQAHAHDARAHVVGVSMGGFIAQRVATSLPSLVQSLFVTGASPFTGWTQWIVERPVLVYASLALMVHVLPDAVYWWSASTAGVQRHEELLVEMRKNCTRETTAEIYPSLLTWKQEDVGRLKVRTLAVAGGKGDDVVEVAEMGKRLKARGGLDGEGAWPEDGSGAVVVKEAIHAWDLQLPEVFSRGVIAWVRGENLPVEFERL
ncbi:Alpha/Beta hydrolase protein [Plectosphaerella plurivora]|uniref:Alpha/Beta hydrolase protein n=1 Tax=Plectosphaerella plurivora TaxID=936078 RepID=A0A9P8V170_9PEZI|nr:Alpha/Beta hydrolase protein [Plectosphaerella plurivora]